VSESSTIRNQQYTDGVYKAASVVKSFDINAYGVKAYICCAVSDVATPKMLTLNLIAYVKN
jgi:hypothetical protein